MFYSFGGWKSKIGVPACSGAGESSPLGCRMPTPSRILTWLKEQAFTFKLLCFKRKSLEGRPFKEQLWNCFRVPELLKGAFCVYESVHVFVNKEQSGSI